MDSPYLPQTNNPDPVGEFRELLIGLVQQALYIGRLDESSVEFQQPLQTYARAVGAPKEEK